MPARISSEQQQTKLARTMPNKQNSDIIISRNYIDRESPNKWLMRRADQSSAQAKAVPEFLGGEFQFETSTEIEKGFGCAVVCRIFTAEKEITAKPAIEIKFDGRYSFYINGVERPVCAVLNGDAIKLTADGLVLVELPSNHLSNLPPI